MADPVDPNQTDTKPSLKAPGITASGQGSNVLMPGQVLPGRRVSPGTQVPAGVTVTEKDFQNGMYVGQALVDSKGNLIRGQYTEDEAYAELVKLGTPAKRLEFLGRLQNLGIYGRSKPSATGFAGRDLSAVKQAMLYANANGVTLDVAATMMAADPNIKAQVAATGARVRTTPKQDLRAVFKQAAGSVLGRQLSDADVEKFVRSYNQAEVTEAMGGAAAPSVQVAAQEAVTSAAPDEAAAMGALQLANIMDQKIKALG